MSSETASGRNIIVPWLGQITDIASRRRWVLFFFVALGAAAGLMASSPREARFRAETLVAIQHRSEAPSPSPLEAEAALRSIVDLLTETVTSRFSLENLIVEEDLYRELRDRLPMEQVVAAMRDDLEIGQVLVDERDHGGARPAVAIGYSHDDAARAERVVNRLAAGFVAENRRYRREWAEEASVSTGAELLAAKEMLDGKEAVLQDYRRKYADQMAARRQANQDRLTALRAEYDGLQDSIEDLRRARDFLAAQLDDRRAAGAGGTRGEEGPPAPGGTTTITIDHRAKLRMLRDGLAEIRGQYAGQNPRLQRLEEQIADVERRLRAAEAAGAAAEAAASPDRDQELTALQARLRDADSSLARLGRDKAQLEAEMAAYENAVALAAVREAEWSSLEREYEVLKNHYDHLAARNLQANLAAGLELVAQEGRSSGERPPVQLSGTSGHRRFRTTMMLAILAGALAGSLVTIALEAADKTLKTRLDVERACAPPVLCSVPRITLKGEGAAGQLCSYLVLALLLLLILTAVFAPSVLIGLRNAIALTVNPVS